MLVEKRRALAQRAPDSPAVEVVVCGLRVNPPGLGVNLSKASEYLRR